MDPNNSFTICVLLFGDHTVLGHRCLSSIIRACSAAVPAHLRVGLNAVSNRTERFVATLIESGFLLEDHVWRSAANIHKYPMMRRMFYDKDRPIETPYVMWFDDDSFIKEEMVGASPSFLQRVLDTMDPPAGSKAAAAAMCGAIYTMGLMGSQQQFIEDQPWYRGKKIPHSVHFATGGWWTISTSALRQLDYPWPNLDHRGGDVMLGHSLVQNNLVLANFRDGIAVNADGEGRESKAKRRGFDQTPIGVRYTRRRKPAPAAAQAPAVQAAPGAEEPASTSAGTSTRRPAIDLDL